ncbi:GlsB/YeaQ/YmgE family stress response membrane protein [Metaplanococcus flavidus]
MGFFLFLIMGGIIGWLAGLILGKDVPGGIIGNIIAGIIGAWLGSLLLGDWGPEIWGVFIIPALIGALILVFVLSLILGSMGRNRRNRA